jgi:diguanylate cyclase (GGDEF)-like protein/PAS domain S-box-containing protein
MKMFAKDRTSIQFTFMGVLVPVLVVTLLIVAVLTGLYINQAEQKKLAESHDSIITLYTQVLSDKLQSDDVTSADKLLEIASYDDSIVFMELTGNSGKVIASVGKPDSNHGVISSRVIDYGPGSSNQRMGELRYQLHTGDYKQAVIKEVAKVMLLLVIALVVISIVMYVVYRRHIHAPIHHFITSLLKFSRGDSDALVNWNSKDEFGTLAMALTTMQRTLNKNQSYLVESALRYQSLYNKTPAMLFSMNNEGVVTDASVYFLKRLGHKKSSLIGHSLSEMVCDNFPGTGGDLPLRLADGGRLSNFQTCITTGNGETMDVIINTMPIMEEGEEKDAELNLCVMTDITKQVHAQDTVFRQANYDVVTDLPNRFFFTTRFRSLLDSAMRVDSPVSVIFIDLDRFKWVNDTFGHSVGDALLSDAGNRIREAVSDKALVCRFGGDEFIVALHLSKQKTVESKVADNILRSLAEPFRIQQHEIHLSASIGISSFPSDGESPDELIGAADTAMYHAKNRGGDAFEYYEGDMHERIQKQLQLDNVLRTGLIEERFYLVFQPIVDISRKESALFEVLLRFSHPQFPDVSPAEFIPLAETTGLIRPIGQFVIRNSLLHLHALDNQGDDRYSLTINISPRQLQDETFVDFLQDQIEEFKVEPERVILEITENSLMENNVRIEKILEQIRQLGCRIAIDDFGTGFSSLSYLRRFAVDILKIDQSFIQRVPDDESDSNLIRGIINMARELGIVVIAEGVEKESQYDFLVENGCDLAQGYFFSKPVKAEQVFSKLVNI